MSRLKVSVMMLSTHLTSPLLGPSKLLLITSSPFGLLLCCLHLIGSDEPVIVLPTMSQNFLYALYLLCFSIRIIFPLLSWLSVRKIIPYVLLSFLNEIAVYPKKKRVSVYLCSTYLDNF